MLRYVCANKDQGGGSVDYIEIGTTVNTLNPLLLGLFLTVD